MNNISSGGKAGVWWRGLCGLVLVLLVLAGPAQAQDPARQKQLEELEANLAVLRQQVEETPDSFRAWNSLLTAETMAVYSRAWGQGLELSLMVFRSNRGAARCEVFSE